MISGPPGIGKSSMVKIITQELGLGVVEINASDKRSKNMIEGLLKELCESSTINFFMKDLSKEESPVNKKTDKNINRE